MLRFQELDRISGVLEENRDKVKDKRGGSGKCPGWLARLEFGRRDLVRPSLTTAGIYPPLPHHTMGAVCCRSQPIDFDGEVTLFHFRLLKVVGKGAFGKVCPAPPYIPFVLNHHVPRSGWFNTSRLEQRTPSSISIK